MTNTRILVLAVLPLLASCANRDIDDARNSRVRELEARIEQLEAEVAELGRDLKLVDERAGRQEESDPQPGPPVKYLRDGSEGAHPEELFVEPRIDGVITRISKTSSLIFVSAGRAHGVTVGARFTVFRENAYLSKLVVDHVEETWSSCHELPDFRKSPFEVGDNVSTRVFD